MAGSKTPAQMDCVAGEGRHDRAEDVTKRESHADATNNQMELPDLVGRGVYECEFAGLCRGFVAFAVG